MTRAWAIAVLVCVSGVFCAPILIDPAGRIAGGNGDPLLIAYIITWVAENLGSAALWNPPFFHPSSNVLAWSDHMIGLGVIAWPAVALGVSPIVLTNALAWLAFLLSSVALFVWLEDEGYETLAAFAAAVVVTYGAWRVQQLAHLHLLVTPFLPLALICYGRATGGRGPLWLMGTGGVMLALQTYFTASLAVYMLPLVGVWTTLRIYLSPQARVRKWIALAASFALVGLANVPVAMHYWAEEGMLARTHDEVLRFSVQWVDWVSAGAHHWLYGDRLAFTLDLERELFPGVGFAAILAIGIAATCRRAQHESVRASRRALWPAILTAALAIWASTGPSHDGGVSAAHLPYDLIRQFVPGGAAVRVPARFVILAGVFLAPALAAGWQVVIDQLRRKLAGKAAPQVVALMLVLAVTAEAIPGAAVYEPAVNLDALVISPPLVSDGVLFLPALTDRRTQIRRMWAARRMGVATVNGYSGHESVLLRSIGHLEQATMDLHSRRLVYARLLHAGVDTIVAHGSASALIGDELRQLDSRVYRVPRAVDVPSMTSATPGAGVGLIVADHGWSYPEHDAHDSWVWSHSRRATLLLPLEGVGRRRLSFRVRALRADSVISASWNGMNLGQRRIGTTAAWVSFSLPETPMPAGWADVELRGPEPVPVPDSPDPRRLSVCLYEVRWD